MDEFAGYHALGCAAHPLSREFHVFREGCGQYGLRPPFLPVALPLRSYLYIGSLPVLPFYPFWMLLDDPVAVRVQGSLFLFVAILLAARLVGASWPRVALAAFVFPLFVGSFLVDTGPVGLQLLLLISAVMLLTRAASPGGSPRRDAAIAGFLCFLGVWIKLVFVWLIPATIVWTVVEFRRSSRSFLPASVAFLACFLGPSAALLLSRDTVGLPYYEVLSVGRFSLEPQSIGTVAASLFAYVRNGSSLAPRSVFFPESVLDALPLLTATAILVSGLGGERRRDVAMWIGAAVITFGVTVLSGRALASHHLAFTMGFVFLALATSLARLPRRTGLTAVGALVALFWGSLLLRAPTTEEHSNRSKDQLLAWIRSDGLDKTTVQLHASWGTYYIAHLFGDRDEIVLFARKFAREPDYLAAARDVARAQGRSILLLTCEPERFRPDVVEAALGPPVVERRFGNWRALEYRPPPAS
jgi:hypothetical protein